MPHSVKLITRADDFMKNRSDDPSFKEIANDPKIKAFLDTIAKARADCYAKLVKNITGSGRAGREGDVQQRQHRSVAQPAR